MRVVTPASLQPHRAALVLESRGASPLCCALLSSPYLSSYFGICLWFLKFSQFDFKEPPPLLPQLLRVLRRAGVFLQ
ncbi:unnamed protein product [Rangifer tarandus platyrhynchus]|uniref:Uncharacterized protein n=3 Tax=Rangifer tarandus platyrhynchus TaxID=3082113 RepID=A0ABN8ZUF6_RANTA|nr:unnamed protein product [Rangifer tarandus platyrhynchus]CAI9711148.1 unnamed protein product [Rangifer tarandus platyrhynchus]